MQYIVLSVVALLATVRLARADTVPIGPSSGEVYYVGETCRTSWSNDGKPWKDVKVQLMTGVDTVLLDIIDDLDTTGGAQVLSFACPDVTRYSEIYFFRYANNDNKDQVHYTDRFTIAKKIKKGKATYAPTYAVNSTTTSVYSGTTESFAYGVGALAGPTRTMTSVSDRTTETAHLNPEGKYKQHAVKESDAQSQEEPQDDLIDDIANTAVLTKPAGALFTTILIFVCLWFVALM